MLLGKKSETKRNEYMKKARLYTYRDNFIHSHYPRGKIEWEKGDENKQKETTKEKKPHNKHTHEKKIV